MELLRVRCWLASDTAVTSDELQLTSPPGGLQMFRGQSKASPLPPPEEIKRLIPVRSPTWGKESKELNGIKATWLGFVSLRLRARAITALTLFLRTISGMRLS